MPIPAQIETAPRRRQRPPAREPAASAALRRLFPAWCIPILAYLSLAAPAAAEDWEFWGSLGYLGNAARLKDEVRETGDQSVWTTAQEIFFSGDLRYGTFGELAFDLSSLVGNTETDARGQTELAITELQITPIALDSGFSLRLGRQRLRWGNMEYFHPIDTLEEPTNPFRPRQVIKGLDAVRLSYLPSPSLSGTALAIRDREAEKGRFALRYDGLIGDFDVGAGLISYYQPVWIPRGSGQGIDKSYESEYALFFESSGFIGEIGLFAEAQWSTSRNMGYAFARGNGLDPILSTPNMSDTAAFRGALAVQHERFAAPKFKVRAEYFYNSGGYDSEEARQFFDAYQRYPLVGVFPSFGQMGWFSRHYGALGLTNIEITDHLKFGAQIAAGLDSGAALASASLAYSFDNNNGQVFLQYARSTNFRDEDHFPAESAILPSDDILTLYLSWNFSRGSKSP